jgi:asparagine synthase (glutamine-hydrolysing)
MSSLAGIYNFNRQPIREGQGEQLAILWNALGAYGPGGGDVLFAGPVGMCYRAFHVTEESRFEVQPLTGRHDTMIVGDLRLDNREELIASLQGTLLKEPSAITDIELALAAYEKWGEQFAIHLIGEFAVMLYDPIVEKVLLVRDHIGTRPLFYHYDKQRLICSSELGPLLEATQLSVEVNNDYVAGYLMYDPEPGPTAYKNINSVKPFHLLTFTAEGRQRETRYWDLSRIKPIRFKTDSDYVERFNSHFTNAVRGPLRTNRPVFSDLSGGLDSSSIVCVTHRLMQKGEVPAPELFTVSLVSSASPTSDQTAFIHHVEDQIGREGFHIDEYDSPLFSTFSVENALPNLNPLLFCEAKHRRIRTLMEQADARVLLCGSGGDEITCAQQNPSPELADLLVAFRFKALHQRIMAWSKRAKRPYLALLREAVRPVLPALIARRRELKRMGLVPEFVSPKFASEYSLLDRHFARNPFVCDTPSGNDQALGFWTAIRGIAAGHRRDVTRGHISYPFLARPLVEYMQAIPHTQRVQLGKSRFLMRRALSDLLPAAILKRRDKGNPQETIARAFIHEWGRLKPCFDDPRIASYGYVDKYSFVAAVENYRMGKSINLALFLKLLSLEFWLRRLENFQPGTARPRESLELRLNDQYARFAQTVCAPETS